jgi:hypothetical protein
MARISRRTVLGILGAGACGATPPQETPTHGRISLTGEWRWRPEGAAAWGVLRIPESWPREARGNTARYERETDVPAEWSGRRITLSADCVNSYAEVFVDGAKAGEMRYPAGEVDLTALLRPGQKHLLAMQVVAMPLKAVMLSYSDTASAKTVEGTVQRRGIVGDVGLNAMPSGPRIASVRVSTSVRKWEIAVDAAVEGIEQYRLIARVYDGDRLVKEFTGGRDAWRPEKLWDVHTPQNQYRLSATLADTNGKVLDTALPVHFGFRELWIDGRDFYLNGTRIYLSSTPLDNAQTSVASASYDATRATLKHFKTFGMNFVYTHNYGCEPGTHYDFDEVLRAADDEGMLVAFSQPHFGQYDWTAADAEQTNGYARHAAFYAHVAGSHPSVVFYSTSHNGAGYAEDMNPDLIDGVHEPRDQWSARGAQRARRAESIIRGLDPSRIVYHHSGGNLNAMHTVNFYGNWIPPQEMDDWFEHWATAGVKPLFLCEYSVPFLWDWGMYRGWYKGKREFGSAIVPWEFCVAEWDAQSIGARAYQVTEEEKVNLRWEADQFRKGRAGWYRWDYPHSLGAQVFENRLGIMAAQVEENWRAFRTWGVSANGAPWDIGNYWKKDGSPTAVAEALQRCNMPVLAYLAGKPSALTGKDHNFLPGETVEKQLVVINNGREPVRERYRWQFDRASGGGEVSVPPGGQQRIPIRVNAPASGRGELHAEFGTIRDSFAIDVVPRPVRSAAKDMVAVFDPAGAWKGQGTRIDAGADLAPFDTLIVGKGALSVDGAAPDFARVRDGLKVIVFEQTGEALEKRFGFRVAEYGLRWVFPRVPGHALLAGLEEQHLRNWRGESTLLPPRLKYETNPLQFNGAPTVKWAGIPVTRVWRCGNRGSVASVLIEKPACGDFLPVLDGGYGLQYSPLLEYREGKGMVVFCQMDVTGRTESDPAAETLLANIQRYVADWRPVPRRTVKYEGDPAGAGYLRAAGVVLSDRGELIAKFGLGQGELREHIAAYFEPFGPASPFAGISPADVHNRDPRKIPLIPGGECGGLLAVEGNTVYCQLAPWQFDSSGAKMNQKRTFRNFARMTARLLGNLGAETSTRLGRDRLYMDTPEEWDDPYRFFRW